MRFFGVSRRDGYRPSGRGASGEKPLKKRVQGVDTAVGVRYTACWSAKAPERVNALREKQISDYEETYTGCCLTQG